MKFELYSVRDSVADEFGPIFQCKNDSVACRMFGNMFTVKESKDLVLYHLGSFDTEKGVKAGKPKEVDTTHVVFEPSPVNYGVAPNPIKRSSDEKSTIVE